MHKPHDTGRSIARFVSENWVIFSLWN